MSFATRRAGNFIQPTKEIVEWKQTLGDEDADLEVAGSAKLFSKGAQVHTKGERRKFIDRVLLQVQGGRGGSGCTAFDRSRARYGPPSGADGGDGGDVSIKVGVQETNLRSINRFHIKGIAGQNGSGQWRRGGRGDDVTVLVPRGTVVKDITDSTKEPVVMADLDKAGATIVVARGGTGGRGNATLSALAPQERAKKVHDKGTEGEMRRLQLELKLIADVALVGFPNAGKSTFLAAISNAQPKIASYPFTTLHPTVGVVEFSDYFHFTVADLPGLIEGAHLNVGLGHQFLRHVERTKVLCFVLDMAGSEGRLPWDDFRALQSELEHYQPGLSTRRSVIVANKMDLKRFSSNLVKFSSLFPDLNIPVFPVAASSRRNLRPVMRHLRRMLDEDLEAPAHKVS